MIIKRRIETVHLSRQPGGNVKMTVNHGVVMVAKRFGVVNITRTIGADKHYEHTQSVASATWTINHNLGKFPSVTVLDSEGRECVGDLVHNSVNQCTGNFGSSFGGKAICN